jgi:hypothetical protein
MAGLLSAVAGGALEGLGRGMVAQADEDGRMKREARLLELQQQYAMERQTSAQTFQAGQAGLDRSFRTGEREATQTFTAGESEKGRAFQAGESEKSRGFQAGQADKGRSYQTERDERQHRYGQEDRDADSQRQSGRDAVQHERDLEKIDKTYDAKTRYATKGLLSGTGLAAEDKRQFDALKAMHGDDPDQFRKALVGSGNPRLANIGSGAAESEGPAKPKATEMGADDKRVYDTVVQRHTQPGGIVDWNAVGRDLRANGRGDLAGLAYGQPDPAKWESVPIPPDVQKPKEQRSPAGKPQPKQEPKPSPATPTAAAGQGEPAQPRTQADFDALPKGAVYINPADGKRYRKG